MVDTLFALHASAGCSTSTPRATAPRGRGRFGNTSFECALRFDRRLHRDLIYVRGFQRVAAKWLERCKASDHGPLLAKLARTRRFGDQRVDPRATRHVPAPQGPRPGASDLYRAAMAFPESEGNEYGRVGVVPMRCTISTCSGHFTGCCRCGRHDFAHSTHRGGAPWVRWDPSAAHSGALRWRSRRWHKSPRRGTSCMCPELGRL